MDKSYDVPATTSSYTDPYTNKTMTTVNQGYHVENLSVEVIIKNQPYPSQFNGNTTFLVYNVRFKPHFGETWTEFPPDLRYRSDTPPDGSGFFVYPFPGHYRSDDEIDYQVEAILAYQYASFEWQRDSNLPFSGYSQVPVNKTEAIASSDWSETQTITIPVIASSPEYQWTQLLWMAIIIVGVVLVLVGVGLLVYSKKRMNYKVGM